MSTPDVCQMTSPDNPHYADPDDRLFWPGPVQTSDTDERYTPRWVFDALAARFDLDPAAAPGGANVPADKYYTADDDGLSRPWVGLVWLNPPFSNMPPWVDRWLAHHNGCLLFPWTDSEWHRRLLDAVPLVVLLDRPKFEHPTHTGRHVPVACAVTALGDGLAPLQHLAAHECGRALTVGWVA